MTSSIARRPSSRSMQAAGFAVRQSVQKRKISRQNRNIARIRANKCCIICMIRSEIVLINGSFDRCGLLEITLMNL